MAKKTKRRVAVSAEGNERKKWMQGAKPANALTPKAKSAGAKHGFTKAPNK